LEEIPSQLITLHHTPFSNGGLGIEEIGYSLNVRQHKHLRLSSPSEINATKTFRASPFLLTPHVAIETSVIRLGYLMARRKL